MQRIRVLFLIDKLVNTGGAEMFAFGLATHLPSDRFESWLCSTRVVDAERSAALSEAGVRHVHLDRRTKWDVHHFAPLPGLLRRERIDILHAHKFGSNVWGTLLGRAARVPIVLAHEQTWSYQGDPLRRFIDGQLIGRLATRFIAVSSRDAERMRSVEGVRPEKIVMIPNAFVPRPATPDGDLRTELGLERSAPLIGVVAVLRRQKALSVLLRAHLRVLDQIPDAHVVIAGDGECRAELQQLCRELVRRAGFIFSESDRTSTRSCAQSTSRRSPRTTRERRWSHSSAWPAALRSWRPPSAAFPDIVRDGETGILVPPRDPTGLADALAGVLSDPDRGRRTGGRVGGDSPPFHDRRDHRALCRSLRKPDGGTRPVIRRGLMERIRVLFLIDELAITGGAEVFALGLATHLPAERFDRWLCSTRLVDPGMSATLVEAGVKHVHLDRRTKWDVHRFAPLPGLLRREKIEILHAHKFGSNVWGTLIGRAARVPIVLAHEQTWSYEGDPMRRLLDGQLIARLATRFIAVSSRDAERMRSVEGVPAEKIVMIPNAYVPRPETPDADLRAELGLESSTPLIGVVAILRPQKALDVLLKAHAQALQTVPDAHLVIAGDGPCRRELDSCAASSAPPTESTSSACDTTSTRSSARSMSPSSPPITRARRWWRSSAWPTGLRSWRAP